jgi:pyruvate kinase
MHEAGMNGARINTAFADIPQYREVIARVRRVGDVPIFLDLKGPELRVRTTKALSLKEGDGLTIGEGKDISFNHPVYGQLRIGDKVLFDDAKIETEVSESEKESLSLRVKVGGLLEDGKGVNCPGRRLDVPTLSQRDLDLIRFAREQDVEFIGLSFTRDADDVRNLKKELRDSEISVVAKIENGQGVEAFDQILSEADGIMVARGDLGIEVEQERVPLLQKRMISACNQVGKTVITATEMLESMRESPRPTRAEVSDVANAILDGTDVVMLSGETAIGKYPAEAVAMMTSIARQTEEAVAYKVEKERYQNISSAISWSVNEIARSMPLNKVVTITRTGYTARAIARFKLKQPIIAVTRDPTVKRKLELVYGVHPIHLEYGGEEDRILSAAQALLSEKMVSEEDIVLFTAAFRTSQHHASNLIEIHTIKELMEFRGHRRPMAEEQSYNPQP